MAVLFDTYLKKTGQTLDAWLTAHDIKHVDVFRETAFVLGLVVTSEHVALVERMLHGASVPKISEQFMPAQNTFEASMIETPGESGGTVERPRRKKKTE